LTSLVKKLEAATSKHSDCRLGAFVVMLSDDEEKMSEKLKELSEKEKIKKVVLCIDNPQGPPKYKIAKEADITVVYYSKRKVVKNFAFAAGKMTEKDLTKVIEEIKAILPDEKK
jgi:uncharacterized protein YcgI (DUF1989 family)